MANEMQTIYLNPTPLAVDGIDAAGPGLYQVVGDGNAVPSGTHLPIYVFKNTNDYVITEINGMGLLFYDQYDSVYGGFDPSDAVPPIAADAPLGDLHIEATNKANARVHANGQKILEKYQRNLETTEVVSGGGVASGNHTEILARGNRIESVSIYQVV